MIEGKDISHHRLDFVWSSGPRVICSVSGGKNWC